MQDMKQKNVYGSNFQYESNPTATARLPKIHVFKKVSVEKLQRHQQIFAETSLK